MSPNNIHYTYICHISRSCEYALCRLLCTEPSLDIADIFKTKFSDVTNTPECGPHSLIGEADKCYKLKENLHVGGKNLKQKSHSSMVVITEYIMNILGH